MGRFYKNLEKLCKREHTSPSAACVAIGRSRSAASAWKQNGTLPKEPELELLAKHLHCDVSDFFVLGAKYSDYTEMLEAKLASGEYMQPDLDDNAKELMRIYQSLSTRQRVKLMSLVYEFEETVQQ
jgi:hypothetical protein